MRGGEGVREGRREGERRDRKDSLPGRTGGWE